MSWYIPPQPVIASEVLDIDAFNLNMAAIHRELGGELNEQNFDLQTLSGVESKWATDIGISIQHAKAERDPYDGTSPANVPVTMTWTPVDGSRKSFQSIGGKALMIYSFQMSSPSAALRQPGQNFCIEIDGVPYIDCLIGGGDQTNDWIQMGVIKFVSTGVVGTDPGSGPGFKGDQRPYVCELVANLPPGSHVVRLLSRNIDTIDSTPVQQVSNLEGILAMLYA